MSPASNYNARIEFGPDITHLSDLHPTQRYSGLSIRLPKTYECLSTFRRLERPLGCSCKMCGEIMGRGGNIWPRTSTYRVFFTLHRSVRNHVVKTALYYGQSLFSLDLSTWARLRCAGWMLLPYEAGQDLGTRILISDNGRIPRFQDSKVLEHNFYRANNVSSGLKAIVKYGITVYMLLWLRFQPMRNLYQL